MDSDTIQSLRLPIVVFSIQSMKPKTPEWDSVRAKVREALEEFGCFEALFEIIPLELRRKQIFEVTKEFFDLPLETKKMNVSNKPYYGYTSFGEDTRERLSHESVIIEDSQIENMTNVTWPQGNPNFCKTMRLYLEQLSEMDKVIRKMIFESFGVKKHNLESTLNGVRIIKYNEDYETSGTKKISLGNHRDKDFLAILNQNEVDGLEVQKKDGLWISCKPSPGSFTVILGEFFHVLSNGRLHCPVHRVVMSGNKPRYSTVFYSNPEDDFLIKTLEETVDENHPLLFKPFYFQDYLTFVYSGTVNSMTALQDFCAISPIIKHINNYNIFLSN